MVLDFIKGLIEFLTSFLKKQEPERPSAGASGKKLLWYPLAHTSSNLKMPTQGTYAKKYPVGAVVHFTAGRYEGGLQKAIDSIEGGIKNDYAFMCIGNDGSIVQAHPLDKWGWHAGISSWPSLGESLSKHLVGIEINNAGKLKKVGTKYLTWFDTEVPSSQVRKIDAIDNMEAGYYHKFTEAQEKTLIDLLLWLKRNNPDVFNLDLVLGHYEISPGRKNDPSGSLSMSVAQLRKLIKEKYEASNQ
jgi:N-acetylmuramoyl-L-alanine amidase